MDIYSEVTIKLMKEHDFINYLNLMVEDKQIPTKNKIPLVYLKVKEYEEAAKKIILDASSKRKELEELKRKYDV